MIRLGRALRVLLGLSLVAPYPAAAANNIRIGRPAGAPVVVSGAAAAIAGGKLGVPAGVKLSWVDLKSPYVNPGLSIKPQVKAPAIPGVVVVEGMAPAGLPAIPAALIKSMAPMEAWFPAASDAAAMLPSGTKVSSFHDLQVMGSAQKSAAAVSGRVFDGARVKKDAAEAPLDGSVEPETVTREIAGQAQEQDLTLRFSRDARKQLAGSSLYASVRLVGGSGSQWYWNQFADGAKVRVLVGGQTMFTTRVESGQTKAISQLVKKDLEGLYSPQILGKYTIAQLRHRLIDELTAYNRYSKPGQPTVIGPDSQVRVVRFMKYSAARALPENQDEQVYEPKLRAPIVLPSALADTRNHLPKAVLLDMSLFQNPVPAEFLEDMGKLMKAGMYFVLMSDRPKDGPGSVEELLTRGLTNRQRDNLTRYKMIVLSDSGNSLAGYKGLFPAAMPIPRFKSEERDIMAYVAMRLRASVLQNTAAEIKLKLPRGVNAAAFMDEFRTALQALELKREVNISVQKDGSSAIVTLRPNSLISALPDMFEALRDREGLFVNNSDLMVISRDADLLKATAGAVQPALHSAAQGAALVDLSLAAMLGKYRENMRGDLAASASKISSFIKNRDSKGGDFGNVYMMMGHVMHSAFNWAVWAYRNTGVLPGADELITRARRNWAYEDSLRVRNMVDRPGHTMDGYREVMEARLRTMHKTVAELLQAYPIVLGTELPNLFVIDRYKKGQLEHRDVLRLIYDFVAARETPDGLEVMVLDFKTGQTPTLQNLEKDVQVQLYDIAVRQLWANVPVPYVSGAARKVASTGLTFIYPNGGYRPLLNEWGRIKYEKFLRQVMDRIRKHNNPPAPKTDKKPAAKSTKTARKA
ncbi:MAG: PD-(D/E)XK nuclease family protein [Elusimicrobiota bacterium]|jgi:hypothetical protein